MFAFSYTPVALASRSVAALADSSSISPRYLLIRFVADLLTIIIQLVSCVLLRVSVCGFSNEHTFDLSQYLARILVGFPPPPPLQTNIRSRHAYFVILVCKCMFFKKNFV